MSTELTTIESTASTASNSINLTQHAGGTDRGRIISLTQRSHHHDDLDRMFQSVELDRERVRDLPNFDAEVFFEISGIDLREDK